MSQSSHVVEAGRDTFQSRVLDVSYDKPVLVDFWADWCAPCRMLAPMLDSLAEAYGGRLQVAKVDTDAEAGLAGQYGVRALPTLKLFRDGQVVEEITGVQSEAALREIVDRHLPRPSDPLRQQAREARGAGDAAKAASLLRRAREQDPGDDSLKLELADALVETGELDDAGALLRELPAALEADEFTRALKARLAFARAAQDAPPTDELERRIETESSDLEARYALAARHVQAGDYEAALDQLLEIMRRDRSFGDDAGRKGMLAVFEMLGGHGELVDRYRRQMSTALY